MSHLCVFHSSNTRQPVKLLNHHEDIVRELASIGVVFEQRKLAAAVTADTTADEVLVAYQQEADRLRELHGYVLLDVLQLDESQPEKERVAQRAEMLAERVAGTWAWLLVAGRCLFQLRMGEQVFALMCEKGDLLVLPEGIRYWFDAGEHPRMTAIRLLTAESGSAGKKTGEDPASQYPEFDDY